MKKAICAFFTFLFFSLSIAQTGLEKFPVFPKCDSIPGEALEDCFYKQFYQALREKYEHPDSTIAGTTAGLRFEVTEKGSFEIIILDSQDDKVQSALENAVEALDPIQPATYSGKPVFMQFIVNIPIPMPENGFFILPANRPRKENNITGVNRSDLNDEKEHMSADSLAFAKAANDFSNLISNAYDKHELRSDAIIPFSYQRYYPYEAAMNKVGTNAHTAVKPYTFNYVDQYYDLEAERESLLKEKSTWLGRKWHNEHFIEIAGEDYWLVLDPGVDLQVGRDLDNDITTFNNTRLVSVNGGIGKQITFGGSIQESQARFPRYFQLETQRRAPDGGAPGIVPGRGVAEDGGTNIFDYPVATGYVNYKPSKFFNLQIGQGQHFIGDGHRSLILSDNAQPFPYFKLNARFWKLDYTVLYTSLRDVRPAVVADDSFLTKYMTHHYLSWNATKRLTVGVFESVLWQNDNGRGFDFGYINPVIFYQTVELNTGSRGGNALLGATAKYKFSDRVTAYGQLVIDELNIGSAVSGDGGYQNKHGIQVGLKYQNAFGINNLMLQAEYNQVRPYTYSHNDIILNYATHNQSLAHPWGANFYEAIGIARYNLDRWYGIGQLIYGQRGFDFQTTGLGTYFGENIYRTEDDRVSDNGNTIAQGNTAEYIYSHLEAGYLINPASRLTVYGQLIYRNINAQIDTPRVEREQTLWINVGVRTDIFNWGYDR
jgi:hypothetical protein